MGTDQPFSLSKHLNHLLDHRFHHKQIGRKKTNGHQHSCLPRRIKGWHLHLPFKEETLQNLYLKYKVKIHGHFSNLKHLQMQPQVIA